MNPVIGINVAPTSPTDPDPAALRIHSTAPAPNGSTSALASTVVNGQVGFVQAIAFETMQNDATTDPNHGCRADGTLGPHAAQLPGSDSNRRAPVVQQN